MPSEDVLFVSRARECRQQGNLREALVLFEAALAVNPTHKAALLGAGQLASAAGDHLTALSRYRAAAAASPDDGTLCGRIGQQLRLLGQAQEAITTLVAATQRFPDQASLHIELARAQREAGHIPAALEAWESALALDPRSKSALIGAAACASLLGDHLRAVRHLTLASKVFPDDPSVAKRLGQQLRLANRAEEAETTLLAAVEQFPDDSAIRVELARTQLKGGRLDAALSNFRAVLNHTPNDRPALLGAVATASALRNHSLAASLLEEADALVAGDVALRARFGQQLRLAGQPERALRVLSMSMERFPDDAGIAIELARTQQEMGLLDPASATWARAVTLAPGDRNAVSGHVGLLFRLGLDQEALDVVGRAQTTSENVDIRLKTQRCRILIATGQLDAATAALPDLIDGSDASEAVVEDLAALIAWGRYDGYGAAAHEERAHSLNPSRARLANLAAFYLTEMDVPAALDVQERWARDMREDPTVIKKLGTDRVIRRTHGRFGDIINELMLNPDAVSGARAAIAAGDLSLAIENERRHPESLAAAAGLMVTARRDGQFEERPATTRPTLGSVPLVLIQAWFGSKLPDDVDEATCEWSSMHPGWTHHVFDDQTALDFLSQHPAGNDAVHAFRAAPHPAAKADLFRLLYLSMRGGVWCDVDDRPVRPLDDLIAGRSLVVRQEFFMGSLGNNFIASAPNHPAIQYAAEEAIRNCIAGYRESIWLATGPGLLTRSAARWLAESTHLDQLMTQTLLQTPPEQRTYLAMGIPLGYKRTGMSWQIAEDAVSDGSRPTPLPTAAEPHSVSATGHLATIARLSDLDDVVRTLTDYASGSVDLDRATIQDALLLLTRKGGTSALDQLWQRVRGFGSRATTAARVGQVVDASIRCFHAGPRPVSSHGWAAPHPLLDAQMCEAFQSEIGSIMRSWRSTSLSADQRRADHERAVTRRAASRLQTVSTPPRVVVASSNWNFTAPLVRAFESGGCYHVTSADMRAVDLAHAGLSSLSLHPPRPGALRHRWWRAVDETGLGVELRSADLVIVDWCNDVAIQMSKMLPRSTRLIVRVHSYEAFSALPYVVNWGGVDGLVFVAEPIRRFFLDQLAERVEGVPTVVAANSMDRLPPQAREAAFPRPRSLGMLQYSDRNKDPLIAAQILAVLTEQEPDWVLRFAGKPWPADDELTSAERTYKNEFFAFIARAKLSDRVFFDGPQVDPAAWFSQIGYVLSCSQREGTHEALLDGLHAGCYPVVRDWPMLSRYGGPLALYPGLAEQIFHTPEEAAAIIKRSAGTDAALPQHNSLSTTPDVSAVLALASQLLSNRSSPRGR